LQIICGFQVNIFRLTGGAQLENASKKKGQQIKKISGKEENTKKENDIVR
jgi:hypothetical protein